MGPRRRFERLVEVGAFDQVVRRDLLLCMGGWTVVDDQRPVADRHSRDALGGMETLGAAEDASSGKALVKVAYRAARAASAAGSASDSISFS
jgi:hypothetical protein